MNVLFYSALSLRFGGGFEHWVLELARRLKKYDVVSTIVCTKSTVENVGRISAQKIQWDLNEISGRYYELPYVSLPMGRSPIPKMDRLKTIAVSCDLIYFSNAYAFQDLLIYLVKRLSRKPVISGQHAVLFQDSMLHNLYVTTIERMLLRKFDAHHVLNSQDLEKCRKWGLRNVNLIPVGVDTQRFRPKEYGKGNSKFRVVFVGRLVPQKGIDVLCRSIELLNGNHGLLENLEFIVAGDGPMKDQVERCARRYKNVRYLGRVEDEALPRVFGDCDLFVMPSRRETFGIVALEAQACGLPVIASNVPGPSDVIIDGTTGSLIQEQSSEALAASVSTYYDLWLRGRARYRQISIEARRNAVKRYDWSVVADRMHYMLMDVMEHRKRQSVA